MRMFLSFALFALICAPQAARSAPDALLELVRTIPLQKVSGRIDHFSVDLAGQRLFVAALGNDSLEVIDLKAGSRLRSVQGFGEPQGVAYVAQFNRIYVASGSANRVDILDGTSLGPIRRIDGLEDADNVRYDPKARQIYVGHGGGALRVLDARTGDSLGDIRLAGHPESFQLEQTGKRIFVNVPAARHVAVVDRARRAVTGTWEIRGATANFPMALDESGRRLFIGTRNPPELVVYDTGTGRRVAALPIGGDTDDIFFDAARKRIYAVCGEGLVSVVRQQDPDRYVLLGAFRTAPRARTGLFVAEHERLYVAVPAGRASSAEVRVYAIK
jgi:DNA-binding beta-propeller fold protein YncE